MGLLVIEIARRVVVFAFKKAEEESFYTSKTSLSEHISRRIEDEYNEYISAKTFIRYYDKFLNGKDNATGTPNRLILNILCKYIGFDSFIDFYNKKENTGFRSLTKYYENMKI